MRRRRGEDMSEVIQQCNDVVEELEKHGVEEMKKRKEKTRAILRDAVQANHNLVQRSTRFQ